MEKKRNINEFTQQLAGGAYKKDKKLSKRRSHEPTTLSMSEKGESLPKSTHRREADKKRSGRLTEHAKQPENVKLTPRSFPPGSALEMMAKQLEKMNISCRGDILSIFSDSLVSSTDNASDYVSYNCPQSYSDLSSLVNTEPEPLRSTNGHLSFSSREMNARSTLFDVPKMSTTLSVDELLSTSIAPEIRKLHRTSKLGDFSMDTSSSDVCGRSASLPHTADMSKFSNDCLDAYGGEFSFDTNNPFDDSKLKSAMNSGHLDFSSSRSVAERFINDEISWAKQYATIPTAVLSDQARAQIKSPHKVSSTNDSTITSMSANLSTQPGSLSSIGGTDCSLGTYFNLRSEITPDIITCRSPVKNRSPAALVGSDKSCASDSKELTLNLSAMDRVLGAFPMSTESSAWEVLRMLFGPGNNRQSLSKQSTNIEMNKEVLYKPENNSLQDILNNIIDENKENMNPEMGDDTLIFTDSILNSTDMKKLQRSVNEGAPRSPLSPLQITGEQLPRTSITKSCASEADIDERSDASLESRSSRSKLPRTTKHVRNKSPSLYSSSSPSRVKVPSPLCRSPSAVSSTSVKLSNPPLSPIPSQSCGVEKIEEYAQKALSSTRVDNKHEKGSNYCCNRNRCEMSSASISPSTVAAGSCQNSSLSGGSESASPRAEHGVGLCSAQRSNGVPKNSGMVIRTSSRCSSSSEYSHHAGQSIPLKLTAMELNWTSVKLRSIVNKALQVKNITKKRLTIRIEACGPGFQLVDNIGSTQCTNSSVFVTLNALECRTIVVSFCPTISGMAIGDVSFYFASRPNASVKGLFMPFLKVPLYAYGGHATLIIQNVLQGPVGNSFIAMGEMEHFSDVHKKKMPILERTFRIYNRGSILGFAVLSLNLLSLNFPRFNEAFIVQPDHVIIPCGKAVTIKITFAPRRDDIRKILKKFESVITLANLRIFTGDEATRQRIKNIVRNMSEEERYRLLPDNMEMLWQEFQDENKNNDLTTMQERAEAVTELIAAINNYDISLTLNNYNADDTIISAATSSFNYDGDDETILCETLCNVISRTPSPSANLDRIDESENNHLSPHGNVRNPHARSGHQYVSMNRK